MNRKRFSIACGLDFPYIENTFESLDLYGLICKILKYLEEVDKKIDELDKDVEEFRKLVENIDDRFNELEHEITIKYNACISYTNSYVGSVNDSLNDKIDTSVSNLEDLINNITIDDVQVINPINARLEDIQKVINDLYEAKRVYAITAGEFDALQLTAGGFDSKHIMAYDFDTYGKSILMNN